MAMDVASTMYTQMVEGIPNATLPTTMHVVVEDVSMRMSLAVCIFMSRCINSTSEIITPES